MNAAGVDTLGEGLPCDSAAGEAEAAHLDTAIREFLIARLRRHFQDVLARPDSASADSTPAPRPQRPHNPDNPYLDPRYGSLVGRVRGLHLAMLI